MKVVITALVILALVIAGVIHARHMKKVHRITALNYETIRRRLRELEGNPQSFSIHSKKGMDDADKKVER